MKFDETSLDIAISPRFHVDGIWKTFLFNHILLGLSGRFHNYQVG